MAKYVAPKSLTLDIKDMFKADDFTKDTSAHGVVVVQIKRAIGFKKGDTDFLNLKKASADPYVSVSWAKFGKSVWSTRVIVSEMEPIWDETGFIIVGPKELNAKERLSETSTTSSI
jgi:Ca2+-dependent lipid-binding protein